ncbi:hypothetical protein E2C01_032181 [Portunus trituberculatus]|uniref:Uncharacterized protein n=1 Tax=Portunus trituberculatus TaxID=210409 RepID=A0A5B7EUQ3_PORTR|nr:hypothetical protein [Portunus trituberculatus]
MGKGVLCIVLNEGALCGSVARTKQRRSTVATPTTHTPPSTKRPRGGRRGRAPSPTRHFQQQQQQQQQGEYGRACLSTEGAARIFKHRIDDTSENLNAASSTKPAPLYFSADIKFTRQRCVK